jgi:hypothetical protein
MSSSISLFLVLQAEKAKISGLVGMEQKLARILVWWFLKTLLASALSLLCFAIQNAKCHTCCFFWRLATAKNKKASIQYDYQEGDGNAKFHHHRVLAMRVVDSLSS